MLNHVSQYLGKKNAGSNPGATTFFADKLISY
jgi:hypothetical protein